MYHNKVVEGYYILWPMLATMGVVTINYLMKYAFRYYTFPILQYIGRNSLVFFTMHIVIGNLDYIFIFKPYHIISYHIMEDSIKLAVYLISYLSILPLMTLVFNSRLLRFAIGK